MTVFMMLIKTCVLQFRKKNPSLRFITLIRENTTQFQVSFKLTLWKFHTMIQLELHKIYEFKRQSLVDLLYQPRRPIMVLQRLRFYVYVGMCVCVCSASNAAWLIIALLSGWWPGSCISPTAGGLCFAYSNPKSLPGLSQSLTACRWRKS